MGLGFRRKHGKTRRKALPFRIRLDQAPTKLLLWGEVPDGGWIHLHDAVEDAGALPLH